MSNERNLPPVGENKMGVQPVENLLFTMALPMIIAMLVQAMYNVVDSFFVAKISDSAPTAMALVFPVQNILIGCATGVGVGVNSLLSKCLGQKNQEGANRAAGNGIFLVLIFGVLFILFGIFGSRPFYASQSDIAETVEMSTTYSMICCVFSMGIFLEILSERLLQASGRTHFTLFTQGTGAIINIILDPLLIFGVDALGIPAMGIAGAAVATVIGQWIAAILGILFNLKFNKDVQFSLAAIRPRADALGPILTVGVPSIIMMAISSVMNFCMNQILRSFTETAVGVFGIYFKLQSFFFMPIFGINNAAISIMAFNYGAKKPERIVKTLICSITTAVGIMVVGLAVFQIFPDQLMGMFSDKEEFLHIGRKALRIISIPFPLAAVCIATGACFQALGNGIYTTLTSLGRQLIVLLPAAYLLSLTGEVTNVWWAFPIAESISVAATAYFFLRIYKEKIKPIMN